MFCSNTVSPAFNAINLNSEIIDSSKLIGSELNKKCLWRYFEISLISVKVFGREISIELRLSFCDGIRADKSDGFFECFIGFLRGVWMFELDFEICGADWVIIWFSAGFARSNGDFTKDLLEQHPILALLFDIIFNIILSCLLDLIH